MSDIAQHGLISTFQRLSGLADEKLERELADTSSSGIALVLPCTGVDLGEPALSKIIAELSGAKFLSEVVVSLNRLREGDFERACALFASPPLPHRLVWTDGARLSELWRTAGMCVHGKGGNVWAAIGLLAAERNTRLVVTQDCDVLTFQRRALARLCYPAANRALGYGLAKAYYPRVSGRIYGRVSRLFLAPLLQAIVRIAGHHPLLDFLLSFRYPLAGETAVSLDLAASLPITSGWGLELGLLCEAFRRSSPRAICQVDASSQYDHRHQPLFDADGGGLVPMAHGVAQVLGRELRKEGLAMDSGFIPALTQVYVTEAGEALRRSEHLALMNALPYPAAEEQQAVAAFTAAVSAVEISSAHGGEQLPAWDHLITSQPELADAFRQAVADANA